MLRPCRKTPYSFLGRSSSSFETVGVRPGPWTRRDPLRAASAAGWHGWRTAAAPRDQGPAPGPTRNPCRGDSPRTRTSASWNRTTSTVPPAQRQQPRLPPTSSGGPRNSEEDGRPKGCAARHENRTRAGIKATYRRTRCSGQRRVGLGERPRSSGTTRRPARNVCVIDTGVDYLHKDLTTARVIKGWDCVN